VKTVALLAASLVGVFSSLANAPSSENFSPHLSTNTPIIWEATTNLPKDLWIYKRILPHIFPATAISNAIVLASLEKRGFPKPSINDFWIAGDRPQNYEGPIPTIFEIRPGDATLSYFAPHPDTDSTDIPNDEIFIKRTFDCAAKLGIDLAQVVAEKPGFILIRTGAAKS